MARPTIAELEKQLEQALKLIDQQNKEIKELNRRKVVPETMYNSLLKRHKELEAAYKSLTQKQHNERHAGRKSVPVETREKVQQLKGQGMSIRNIAKEVNIAIGTVHKIINEQK